jgi:hypothetical protein
MFANIPNRIEWPAKTNWRNARDVRRRLDLCRRSSEVEQRFRKPRVVSSILTVGFQSFPYHALVCRNGLALDSGS